MDENSVLLIVVGAIAFIAIMLVVVSFIHYKCNQPQMAMVQREAEAKIKRAIVKIQAESF